MRIFSKSLFFIIIVCSIFFQSCKILKLLNKDSLNIIKINRSAKIIYNPNCIKYICKNNKIYLPVIIDNKYDTLLFDSGCNSYLNYFEYINTIPQNTKVMSILAVNSKSKQHYSYKTVNIENDIFTGYNCMQMTHYLPFLKLNCDNDSNLNDKIIGTQFLPREQYIVAINFSDSSLCIKDPNSIDTIGYKRIRSSFENKVIYIYVTIDGVEYKFLFDTGSDLCLTLNKRYYKNHKNIDDLVLDGSIGFGANGLISGKIILKQHKQVVYLTKNDSLFSRFRFLEKLNHNNMGIGFISKFDWIFDFNNKVVYIKPLMNINNDDTNKINFTYKVAVLNDKLIILIRNFDIKPKIPLYTAIKSVNGITITSENICFYKDFLNENSDWSNLKIEFY